MSMTNSKNVLDLYELALLLNYERASTEPRFRHAKLREVATPTCNFKTVRMPDTFWDEFNSPKIGLIFDKRPSKTKSAKNEPDLPSNMLPTPIPANLQSLTPKDIETIYWQARGHDGCFKTVALWQHFFDLYPANTPLRVRTSTGEEYTTSASSRVIFEMDLFKPKPMSMSVMMPGGQTYITGEGEVLTHAVVGFSKSPTGNIDTVVDLSSMQFGDAGRGLGGRSTFALESLDAFYDRIERVAMGADTDNAKTSGRIGPCPDDVWLKGVAKRVKGRWEKRDTEHWCGHCGAPALQGCSVCKESYYCDEVHQTAAWPFHKRFCSSKGPV